MAALHVDAAYMIFLAGPALSLLPDVMIRQTRDILTSQGASEDKIVTAARQYRQGTALLRAADNPADAKLALNAYLKAEGMCWWERKMNIDLWATHWGIAYAHYDPMPALQAFNGPILALFGGTDLQVSAAANAPVMRSILSHESSTVTVLPGLNHLFQPSPTGRIENYAKIETTIDKAALDTIGRWLNSIEAATSH